MRIQSVFSFSILVVLVASISGCQSNSKKNEKGPNKKKAPVKKVVKNDQAVDLTGVWIRQGETTVEFDCVDSVQTLELTRRLTEDESFLKSYMVELTRTNGNIKGQAVFQYADEPETDFKLNWTLTKLGDYEYKVASESFEVIKGKETRSVTEYVVKIKPKFPPKAKMEPKAEEMKTGKDDMKTDMKDETSDMKADMKDETSDMKSDMDAKKAEMSKTDNDEKMSEIQDLAKAAVGENGQDAAVKLLNADASASDAINKAIANTSDRGAQAKLALILALRGDARGLRQLSSLRVQSDLSMVQKLGVDRSYQIAIASLGLAKDFNATDSDKEAIVKNVRGPEAAKYSEAGRKAVPELTAIDWLKSEDMNARMIAETVLFPNQTILNDQFGEFEGSPYFADDPDAQRDAAADEFIQWFDTNVRSKLSK